MAFEAIKQTGLAQTLAFSFHHDADVDAAGVIYAVIDRPQISERIAMIKQSLSYQELTQMDHDELENLVTKEMLDDETLARIGHLGRFLARIGEMMPANSEVMVRDVLTEEEAQAMWRETADEGVSSEAIGRHPLIH